MDKDKLAKLRPLWSNYMLWQELEEYFRSEMETALNACKTKTDERALGKYYFLRELVQLRERAKAALGE